MSAVAISYLGSIENVPRKPTKKPVALVTAPDLAQAARDAVLALLIDGPRNDMEQSICTIALEAIAGLDRSKDLDPRTKARLRAAVDAFHRVDVLSVEELVAKYCRYVIEEGSATERRTIAEVFVRHLHILSDALDIPEALRSKKKISEAALSPTDAEPLLKFIGRMRSDPAVADWVVGLLSRWRVKPNRTRHELATLGVVHSIRRLAGIEDRGTDRYAKALRQL